MARQLISALQYSGHTVDIVSDLRSFDGSGDSKNQAAIRSAAHSETSKIIRAFGEAGSKAQPKVWFTYHLYYKAPDWIGPKVSASLGLGYVVAEASHAPKRQCGPWAQGNEAVKGAIRAADSVLSLTKCDIPCVTPLMRDHARHFHLPPFLEDNLGRTISREKVRAKLASRYGLDTRRQWLLTVAMMRPGDKLRSYQFLARALSTLVTEDWQLLIVGDGAARSDVENSFSLLRTVQDGGSIAWAGRLDEEALVDTYAACDVFVWPAVNEAYGMAILEAQAAGMPVVVGNYGGVPDVLQHEVTGLLVEPNNIKQFADGVRRMIDSASLRVTFGERAQAFVNSERSLHQASIIVNEAVLHADAIRRRFSVNTL